MNLKSVKRMYGHPNFESYSARQVLRIESTERERKRRPSKADILETKNMLKDFCIAGVDIPKFNYIYELEQWRRVQIKNIVNS